MSSHNIFLQRNMKKKNSKKQNKTDTPLLSGAMPPTVHVLTWLFSGFYVLCLLLCYFVLVFFSLFSIAITLLGEERANLSAFRTFVRFVLVWFCRFPLPLGIWEGLQFGIVAFLDFFLTLFFYKFSRPLTPVTQLTEIPEYYRNTGIPMKNIGIPVSDSY